MLGLGAVICGGVIAVKGTNMFTETDLIENTYEAEGDFSKISVSVITDDVLFAVAEDGRCRVECLDREGMEHDVRVENDTLIVTSEGESGFTFNFDIDNLFTMNNSPKMVIYLPETEYESLIIDGTTSDVYIDAGITFDDLMITVTTGDVTIKDYESEGDINVNLRTGDFQLVNTTCANLTYNGNTGDVTLSDVRVSLNISIDITTGDVVFDHSDAFNIDVGITTGDIEGSLLSAKSFDCSVTTGDISVPADGNGGNCHMRIVTGDIYISVAD